MRQDDYFDLKSFSYYPRHYRRADFAADVLACDSSRLPFRISGGACSDEPGQISETTVPRCRSVRSST
jgi:hypothetical protein